MKNLFKVFIALVIGATTLASCNSNNDYDDSEYWKQVEANKRRIDSILKVQAPVLEAYAKQHFDNPQLDDSTGFWFDELAKPTEEDDKAYEYVVNSNGTWRTPTATVKYEVRLLTDDAPVDAPSQPVELQIVEASQFNPNGLIQAWPIAFRPAKITFNGQKYNTGLVEKGLKKGSKIRFVAPSPYCYDNTAKDKIPANSPLDFTIEVKDIK